MCLYAFGVTTAFSEQPLGIMPDELPSAFPGHEASELAAVQDAARRDSGKYVAVLLTEYGQLVAPVPAADPEFNLSLDEGLLTALTAGRMGGPRRGGSGCWRAAGAGGCT